MVNEDDEMLQMYIEESREHLADIETDLLAIEEGGADIDEDLVNKVFRAAHSMKGGAGFMELNNVKDLAHSVENVLGMIRSREVVPNPDIMNIILLAFDKLREMIDDDEQGESFDISEHVEALTSLTTALVPEEKKESVTKMVDVALPNGKVIFQISSYNLNKSQEGGKYVYLIEYDLIHDVQAKGKVPFDVCETLESIGEILDFKVDATAVGTFEDDSFSNRIPFFILLSTITKPVMVSNIFEVDNKYIHLIEGSEGGTGDELLPTATVIEDVPVQESVAPPELLPEPELEPPVAEEPEPKTKPAKKTAKKKPAPKKKKNDSDPPEPTVKKPDTSLRINVGLLDTLMNLAGELVLSRNQLVQAITSHDQRASEQSAQKMNIVTSELQEAIMLTRMQPIKNIFNKFPRVVHDLSRDLDKEMELIVEGKEVELDKTLIEGLSDPLTHLIRNSIDHGIEMPDIREKAGKDRVGTITLRAFHQAGQVNIEIIDDGKGLDGDKIAKIAVKKGLLDPEHVKSMSATEKINLIFLPGFSTAEKVTDVSGRGVGMDVVKTNLDRMGGTADIESEIGVGTTIRIKLPLTLAILPSLMVSVSRERFAIPQVNVDELLRISSKNIQNRLEKIGDAVVVRLRETLLPLVNLSDVLGIDKTYLDPNDEAVKEDRRKELIDRRSKKTELGEDEEDSFELTGEEDMPRDEAEDRRTNPASAISIVVVSAGSLKYGLVVDELHGSEEIVIKPLGHHLKICRGYAGATVLGDGRVALILDVVGLASLASLTTLKDAADRAAAAKEEAKSKLSGTDSHRLLIFRSSKEEQFAVSLEMVLRIERVNLSDIERVGSKRVLKRRDKVIPIFAIDEVANVKPIEEKDNMLAVIFIITGKEVGLLASQPINTVDISTEFDESTFNQPGIMGSVIINDVTTLLVDMFQIVEEMEPGWFTHSVMNKEMPKVNKTGDKHTILLAEDSEFFRNNVSKMMEDHGYNVLAAEDGAIAWNALEGAGGRVELLVTDIEMPNMNGYELAEKVKGDERFADLPIIAVTSLAGDEDIKKGKEVGIDDYQVKLDKEKLLESIQKMLDR